MYVRGPSCLVATSKDCGEIFAEATSGQPHGTSSTTQSAGMSNCDQAGEPD
jgi:hypothetical protein